MPRRPIITRRDAIQTRRHRRIVIEQPEYRPFDAVSRDAVRRELLKDDAWWFVLHRRGIRRPKVGEDPLEAFAVSDKEVPGTLPERVVYRALLNLRFSEPADFDFQSSLQGGRLELGGIVADFLFRPLMIVLRVQGPSHESYRRQRKDEEQRLVLEEMGFRVFDIEDDEAKDLNRLYDRLRRIFLSGGHPVAPSTQFSFGPSPNLVVDSLVPLALQIRDGLEALTT